MDPKSVSTEGVVLGTREHTGTFLVLWHECLSSLLKDGGEIVPTARTMAWYQALYEAVCDSGRGVCAFGAADDLGRFNALFFAAELPLMYDVRWDRPVAGQSAYVRPEFRRKGWATKLRVQALEVLTERGYRTLLGGAYMSNPAEVEIVKQFDYEPYHVSGALRIGGK